MVEDRDDRTARGGVDIEEQVEVPVPIDIRVRNITVVREVAREHIGEHLASEDALAVIDVERGFRALEIHTEDVGDTVIVEIRHQCRRHAIEPGAGGDVAEVEGSNIAHECDFAGCVPSQQVFASIVVKILHRDDVMLGQTDC